MSVSTSLADGWSCAAIRYFAFLEKCSEPKACTVLLRGGSKDVLNEIERNLQDAIQACWPRPSKRALPLTVSDFKGFVASSGGAQHGVRVSPAAWWWCHGDGHRPGPRQVKTDHTTPTHEPSYWVLT